MKELPKIYEPAVEEKDLYEAWEKSGYFNPDNLPLKKTAKAFSMALPPPNTTAELHMGHAVMLALQDIMVRYHRMRGDRTLWLPGTDHAAIATQNVVEKQLAKQGQKKETIGRERFLEQVDAFVKQSQGTIKQQIRRLGASLDWSRERFTLDAGLSRAVQTMFVKMYNDGLIYRGDRIVNWCPRCQSTLADDEVEYKQTKAPFYYLKYGPVVIGTARPETKFRDKVIVVHPDDERYRDLVGTKFSVDWIEGVIEARVIADSSADPKLGTGAMTLTPAHSFIDFELAKKYGLEIVPIINEEGRLTAAAGSFVGLTTAEARTRVVGQMRLKGLVDHIDEDYLHNLSVCYRCGTPVEPLISKQWFVDVKRPILRYKDGLVSLKDRALAAVTNKEIEIIPKRFESVYCHWLENLRDWCISRQIWYGHRIPVWERPIPSSSGALWDLKLYGADMLNAILTGDKRFETRAGKQPGAEKDWRKLKIGDRLRFTAVNPKNEESLGLAQVTKRIASIQHFVSKEDLARHVPFEQIAPGFTPESFAYHAAHYPGYDERIKKYGIWAFELVDEGATVKEACVSTEPPPTADWTQSTDTLDTWFSSGLWTFSTLGWPDKTPDLKKFHPTTVMETGYDIIFFWVARMILMSTYALNEVPFKTVYLHGLVRDTEGRKMSKSLGNGIDPLKMAEAYGADATRLSLVIGTTPGNDLRLSEQKIAGYRNYVNKLWNISRYALLQGADKMPARSTPKTLADRWIVSRLNRLIRDVTEHLDSYRFSAAAEAVYSFTWHEFADWYLEISKIEKNVSLVRYVLEAALKLLHPYLPFFTERVWKELNQSGHPLLITSWPKVTSARINEAIEREFTEFQHTVQSLRAFKAHSGLMPNESGGVVGKTTAVELLGRLSCVALTKVTAPNGSPVQFGTYRFVFSTDRVKAYASWQEQERNALMKVIAKKEKELLNDRLPETVRVAIKDQLKEYQVKLRNLA